MTDNNEVASIAAGLSASEQEALVELKEHDWLKVSKEIGQQLQSKGLIRWNSNCDRVLTELGKQVLAALQPRPTTITASEFVEQGYAEKIAAKECVVTITDSPMDIITAMELAPEYGEGHYRYFWAGDNGTGITDGKGLMHVRWLPDTPANETDAGEAAKGDVENFDLWMREVELFENAQSRIADLEAQLADANERAAKAEATVAYQLSHEVAARHLFIDDGAISQSSFSIEELVKQLLAKKNIAEERLAASRQREAEMTAALEFYANPALYVAKITTYKTGDYDVECELLYEGGKQAAEALAKAAALKAAEGEA